MTATIWAYIFSASVYAARCISGGAGNGFSALKTGAKTGSNGSKYFADYEDPRFWIMGMEEKGYKCRVAAWVDSPVDAWELSNDIRTELIEQFRACGIKTHKIEHGGGARIGDY